MQLKKGVFALTIFICGVNNIYKNNFNVMVIVPRVAVACHLWVP